MSKTNLELLMEHLKVNCTGEIKLMMKFYLCLHNFSEVKQPWDIAFGVIAGNYLYLKLLENPKRIVVCLKLFWYKVNG